MVWLLPRERCKEGMLGMGLSMTSGSLLKAFKTQSQDRGLGVGHVLLQYGQTRVELAVRAIKFTLASGYPQSPYRS